MNNFEKVKVHYLWNCTGTILRIAKFFWPFWLIKRVLPNAGLFMMVKLRK